MGTFNVRVSTVGSKTNTWNTRAAHNGAPVVSNATAAQIAAQLLLLGSNCANKTIAEAGVGSFEFFLGDWQLDGGGWISFNALPGGFQVDSATLVATTTIDASGGVGTATLTSAVAGTDGPHGNPVILSKAYPTGTSAFDIETDLVSVSVTGSVEVSNFTVNGVYSVTSFQYEVSPTGAVAVGDTITITSDPDDPDALLLDELDVEVNGKKVTPLYQTTYLFIFVIPPWVEGDFPIEAVGNGTQFTGSVLLATLSVLFTDASGIYRIIKDKTNDTVYDDSTAGDDTIDIKFPNPFIKTGFIGG